MRSPRALLASKYSSTRTTTSSSLLMRRSSYAAFYIAAALSGIAAAYVLNEWVLHWWDRRSPDSTDDDDETKPPSPPPTIHIDPRADDEGPAPVADPEHADPNTDASQTRSPPPLRTHSLPPSPNGRAIFSGSSFGTNPDAMASSTSLHTLSTQDDSEQDSASHPNTSDSDTEPFVDILSPSPAHVISRRRSFRNHDLFAQSHMSFSELGSLVAPTDDSELH